MKSRLSYWISSAVKSCLLFLILTLIYSLVFGLLNGDWEKSTSLREIIVRSRAGFYYQIMAVIVMMLWASTVFPSTTDLVLSVGSTRKSAYKGMCVFSGISVVFITVFHTLILLLQGTEPGRMLKPSIGVMGATLIALGFGMLAATLHMKKDGGKVFAILILNCAGSLLSIATLLCSRASFVALNSKYQFPYSEIWCIVSILLGIILCVTGFAKMKKTVNTHEVRV